MLNRQGTTLLIFENFQVDKDLPKHKSEGDINVQMRNGGMSSFDGVTGIWQDSGNAWGGSGLTVAQAEAEKDGLQLVVLDKDSLKEWMGRTLRRWGNKLAFSRETRVDPFEKHKPKPPTLTVEEFFK